MNKFPITIALLVILSLFATADLYINKIEVKTEASQLENPLEQKVIELEKPIIKKIQLNQIIQNYQVEEQFQVSQIFKKINLEGFNNISIYRNKFNKIDLSESFYVYELITPEEQGELSYLNIKLEILAQINNTTQTINETNSFGESSLFFNDLEQKETGFLIVQIGDRVFGFEYDKKGNAYPDIKKIVNELSAYN